MANHRAYMKLYWGAFLADTTHLNATETGAYLMLIAHYWQHGGLPDDDRKLATVARLKLRQYTKMKPTLAAFFQPGWRHKRIDRELQLADEAHEKRSRAGVIGNAARSAMRSQSQRNATHIQRRYITTTEKIPRESKKEASRDKENGNGIEPSAELVETIKRKGQSQ